MERNLLVGNGINIQFGGIDKYSSYAIMNRIVKNINSGKYTILTENSLCIEEQIGLLEGMVDVINFIKSGKFKNKADGLLMLMELDRIYRTYPDESSITSVFLEDYFLAFEIYNNCYKSEDGEKLSETYRKIVFNLMRQMMIDGIYNDNFINEVYKNFYPGVKTFLSKFNSIFTTNYDYNLENILESSIDVCHLHGEFGRSAPEYNMESLFYKAHSSECDSLIAKKIADLEHIYCDAIMSWSWLEKYGGLIEPETKKKEECFKSISGQLEILGLAPANDEHLFLMINNNPKIQSVVYYYLKDEDRAELPHHINKPVTYKNVKKFWNTMK